MHCFCIYDLRMIEVGSNDATTKLAIFKQNISNIGRVNVKVNWKRDIFATLRKRQVTH